MGDFTNYQTSTMRDTVLISKSSKMLGQCWQSLARKITAFSCSVMMVRWLASFESDLCWRAAKTAHGFSHLQQFFFFTLLIILDCKAVSAAARSVKALLWASSLVMSVCIVCICYNNYVCMWNPLCVFLSCCYVIFIVSFLTCKEVKYNKKEILLLLLNSL